MGPIAFAPLRPIPFSRVALALDAAPFEHAVRHAADIAADWTARVAANPDLFNGPFFLLTAGAHDGERFEGRLARTDYASYLHWRAAGFPGGARNVFAMPAIAARSGRVLIGRMAGWTANAGRWYPPAGSLDADDLRADGGFDLEGNMRREVREELGLDLDAFGRTPGFVAVADDGRLALFARFSSDLDEAALARRVERHIAHDAKPEIDAIAFVGTAANLDAYDAPPFLRAFVDHPR